MRICSVDVGYRNFAVCIDVIKNSSIKKLKKDYEKLKSTEKIGHLKPLSEPVKRILEQFHKPNRTIWMERKDFKTFSNDSRRQLNQFLNQHKTLFETCSYIIIEQQLNINHHCLLFGEDAYFWFVTNTSVDVSYTPSTLKSGLLGCPRTISFVNKFGQRDVKPVDKPYRKKVWGPKTALEIFSLQENGDKWADLILNQKVDDLCDCKLMIIAFVVHKFIL